MKQKLLIFFLLLFTVVNTKAQDSCKLRISVLTCAPGEELYSTFGHTALRVIDSSAGTDLVFNWGTFDFSDPDFYTKFVRGKLEYYLSVEKPVEFLYVYQYEKRSILEQELNLSCNEKQQLYKAVQQNLQGANRYYKYDFLLDNCTSRVRDLLKNNTTSFVESSNIVDEHTTYRNLLHEYLDGGGKPWSKLGIDILLGSELDKKAGDHRAMFLPDYLMKGIDSSNNANSSLVKHKSMLYQADGTMEKSWKYTPFLLFALLAALMMWFNLSTAKWALTIARFFNSFLLYAVGLIGFLLLFMWFGTDHTVCQKNYNLIWALPTHFIAAFFIWKRPLWIKKYFSITAIIHLLTIGAWFFIPQQINISLLPIVLLLAFLSYRLSK